MCACWGHRLVAREGGELHATGEAAPLLRGSEKARAAVWAAVRAVARPKPAASARGRLRWQHRRWGAHRRLSCNPRLRIGQARRALSRAAVGSVAARDALRHEREACELAAQAIVRLASAAALQQLEGSAVFWQAGRAAGVDERLQEHLGILLQSQVEALLRKAQAISPSFLPVLAFAELLTPVKVWGLRRVEDYVDAAVQRGRHRYVCNRAGVPAGVRMGGGYAAPFAQTFCG